MKILGLLPTQFLNHALEFYRNKQHVQFLGFGVVEGDTDWAYYDPVSEQHFSPVFLFQQHHHDNDHAACALLVNREELQEEIYLHNNKWILMFHGPDTASHEVHFASKQSALEWFLMTNHFDCRQHEFSEA